MPGLLHIGACEIDVAAREVRLDGRRRSVEPRVLALLVHLAERPDRVVTKQELRDTVWAGQVVSDGALARTAMKARQAIGDSGEPPLIRTVARVGYRLVGAAPALPAASTAPLRLAVLPFDDRTGDAALEWVRLGLMSLVAHSLGRDPRLAIVATDHILAAIEGAEAAGADPVEAVRVATGARVVVRGRLACDQGAYELTLEGAGGGPARIRAGDIGELGPRAAQTIRTRLLEGAAGKPDPQDLSDPMAVTAFARALQSQAQQKPAQAANLLRMTLTLAPGHAAVELELLRALCSLADLDASQPIADRLLADAAGRGDALLAARVHFALARGRMHLSSFDAARRHVDTGLQLLGDAGPADELALGQLLRAKVAGFERDPATLEQALEDMRIACERTGDRLLPIYRLTMLGSMAQSRGELAKAAELYVQAALDARTVHSQRDMVTADCNAASCLMRIGRWADAASHAEQAFAAAMVLDDAHLICGAAMLGTFVYLVAGVPAAGQRLVQALPAAQDLSPLNRQWALLARGNHAASAGDHEAAVGLFSQALQQLRDAGNRLNEEDVLPWLVYSLVRCGRLDEAEAELAAALPAGATPGLDPALHPLCHGLAQVAHARGRPAQALEILLEMLHGETVPLWRAWAALDAAWLHAEAGRGAQALALLPALPPEIAAHPVTHAVAARAHHAAGDRDAARRRQRRYLEAAAGGCAHPFLAALDACYTDAGAAVPKAPGLPSRL